MTDRRLPVTVVLAVSVLVSGCSGGAVAPAASRGECFPVERLPPELRALSEELLLRAMDGEALYTIVGGLKPMSSFVEFRVPLDELDLSRLEAARRALAAWRCGPHYFADVRHFEEPHVERLYAEGAVWNRRALRELIERKSDFFARFGVTPSAHPLEVTLGVEYEEGVDRFRGYGYLYGYPDYAVEYFAAAETEKQRTLERVARDFYSIATFERPEGAYAWAVPKGHVENDADRALAAKAAAILDDYRARRARYVGEGKPGIVELLRDWLDDGSGRLAPENALR